MLGKAKVPRTTAITVAGGQLWYLDSDQHLRAVGIAGHASDMGVVHSLAVAGAIPSLLAVSEDGRRWAWGGCVGCSPSTGHARARIYAGGVDVPEKLVLDESTSNQVLVPIGYTSQGIVVARTATGIGGCCYFPPESGHRDALVVDPTTMQVLQALNGCVSAFTSPQGSFACTGTAAITVHMADGSTRSVTPMSPAAEVGWVRVDDARKRAVFTVIHSRGQGDGGCPCKLDVEAAPLDGGPATVLADQMTLTDVLPDGRIVAATAPVLPGQSAVADWIVGPDVSRVQVDQSLGEFIAPLPLS